MSGFIKTLAALLLFAGVAYGAPFATLQVQGFGGFLRLLTVSGVQRIVFGAIPVFDVTSGIAATGTTQGAAYALTHDYNVISTATAGVNDGVLLLVPVSGLHQSVRNKTGGSINIWPPSGTEICIPTTGCLGLNAVLALIDKSERECTAESTTIWNCR